MEDTEENRTLISSVAEGIGWSHGDTPPIVWPDEPKVFRKYIPIDDDDDLIVFAARAKAAMAERGWVPFSEGNTIICTIELHDEWEEQANGNHRATAGHDYRPSDHIAEAIATLRAIAEALVYEATHSISRKPNAPDQRGA
jgi:hypothetical protein